MPDVHDLDQSFDRVFDQLTRDVTTLTHARGAGAAIRTARRRRTAAGAVAAVAVLAVGGVVLGQIDGPARTAPGPGGNGPTQLTEPALPEPAPLDAAALDAATAGWVDTAWARSGSPVLTDTPCTEQVAVPNPVGLKGGNTFGEFAAGARTGASTLVARFATPELARQAFAEFDRVIPRCPPATGSTELDMASGAAATSVAFDGLHAWVVWSGDRLAIFSIAGARPLTDTDADIEIQETVAEAVLADALATEAFEPLEEGTTEGSGSSGSETATATASASAEVAEPVQPR